MAPVERWTRASLLRGSAVWLPRGDGTGLTVIEHNMTTTAHHLWRTAAVGVAALLLLPSCSSGGEVAPEPVVLESASAAGDQGGDPAGDSEVNGDGDNETDETEPTPVPASSDGPAENWPAPEPPDEIYEPTEEGAEALIQHWFDARHYARITGDTEPLEYVSLEECELCNAELEVLDEVYGNEGWYISEQDSVEENYLRLETSDTATGLLALSESNFETFWQNEPYDETPAESLSAFGFAFSHVDGRWQLHDLNYLGEYEESDGIDNES